MSNDEPIGNLESTRESDLIAAARAEAQALREASPADSFSSDWGGPEAVLDALPGYEIHREIHRGGQGVVYEAFQLGTERTVAIKVMREGPFGGPNDRARFEREVRLLAQLKHPNIVTIHESGTAQGHYFFVMDYIEGQPLDAYFASADRSVEDCLRVFQKICAAVNQAHLRGVIHRDLKPGNIRIDERGEPYVLDFGLAKLAPGVSEADGDQPTMTATGQFVGSLPWSAPEQAEGRPDRIDTRTDVYALGVILFQVLTGTFPYRVAGSVREVLEEIVSTEPKKPSAVRKGIGRDVETIVLKCLQKERGRRYQTAGELERDIGYFLSGLPIEARRDSAIYVLRKTAKRFRVHAAVVLGLVAVALGMLGYKSWSARETRLDRFFEFSLGTEERLQKNRGFIDVDSAIDDAVADYLPSDRELGTVEHLETALEFVKDRYGGSPEEEATLRMMIGRIYLNHFRKFDEAKAQFESALALREDLYERGDVDALDVADCRHNIARTLWYLRRYEEAKSIYEDVLEIRERAHGAEHPEVAASKNHIAACWNSIGDLDKAEVYYREALETREALLGERHQDVAASKNNLASCLLSQGKYAEALEQYEDAADIIQRLAGPTDFRVAVAKHGAAKCLLELNRYEEADERLREAIETKLEFWDATHPSVVNSRYLLAAALYERGRLSGAEDEIGAVLAAHRATPGTKALEFGAALQLAGCVSQASGRGGEAADGFRSAAGQYGMVIDAKTGGDSRDKDLAEALHHAGECYERLGALDDGLRHVEASIEIRRALWRDDHPWVLKSELLLARIRFERGAFDDAKARVERVLDAQWRDASTPPVPRADAMLLLHYCLRALDVDSASERVVEEALAVLHGPAARRLEAVDGVRAKLRSRYAQRGESGRSFSWLNEPASADQP